MRPIDRKILTSGVVSRDLFIPPRRRDIACTKMPRIHITPSVVRLKRKPPRAFGIKIGTSRQIHIVVDSVVQPQASQIETSICFLSIGGHDKPRGALLIEWEKAKRQANKIERNSPHYHVSGTCHYVFVGDNFGSCELEIEVWVEMIVARGIASTLYIHGIVGHAFCLITHQKALTLLGENARYIALFRPEVVAHRLALKLLFAIRKGGVSYRMPCTI